MSTSPNPKNHLTRVQASTIGNIRGILSYPSVVTIDVDNCGIGLVYRLVQFIILTYIIGYSLRYFWQSESTCQFSLCLNSTLTIFIFFKRYELLYKKGYQSFEVATGTVTSKVKGFGLLPTTNFTTDSHVITFRDGILPANLYKILDTADYIIPPNEFNSIFVLTNLINTEQAPGVCEEVQNIYLLPKLRFQSFIII